VATVAATLCRALDLDVDLAWAISLGHDLGHTPFGHVGERIVSELVASQQEFSHELNSLRVVDFLVNYGKGLNLTYAVRDGIATHCGEIFERELEPDFSIKELFLLQDRNVLPATWEGCVVRMADKIAYLGRDLEDALHLKVIRQEEIPDAVVEHLGITNSAIIDTLVHDLIHYSRKHEIIGFSEPIFEVILQLKEFNYRKIYNSPLLADYHKYFARILKSLFSYLVDLFGRYRFESGGYRNERNILAARFGDYVQKMKSFYQNEEGPETNIVLDYIAGMTDDYAIDCISEIMIPKHFPLQFDKFLLGGGS
jgi:dGTPase